MTLTGDDALPVRTKFVFSLGDHTVALALAALSLLYLPFLTDVAGLAPLLAGAVPWIARVVDALTDPIMGRISDHVRWPGGERRRPWFLVGALPFGAAFALLWIDAPWSSEAGRFVYYAGTYVLLSLAMTVVSVPYMALIPEMARGYDERTSLNTWRSALGVAAIFLAIAMAALADRLGASLGSTAAGWAWAGGIAAAWMVLPWWAVYRVSFERPWARTRAAPGFREALATLARHAAYRNLAIFYLLARVALDVVSATLLFYIARVLGRRDEFELILVVFLAVVVVALPLWMQLTRRFDKRSAFLAGVVWWAAIQVLMFAGGPEWSRGVVYTVVALAGVGYAVVDLIPWSMLPDVIDEDELLTSHRREGLYNGTFTFLRKIGGATAVLGAGAVLQLAGYDGELEVQPESAITAIRWLTAGVPAILLLSAAWIARRYPMTRDRHARIRRELEARS